MKIYYEIGLRMVAGALVGAGLGFLFVSYPSGLTPLMYASVGVIALIAVLLGILGMRYGFLTVGLIFAFIVGTQYLSDPTFKNYGLQTWALINRLGALIIQYTTPSIYTGITFWTIAGAVLFSTIGLADITGDSLKKR